MSIDAGRPLVVHVAESFGAGVLTAIYDYVSSTHHLYRHVILAGSRPECSPPTDVSVAVIPVGSMSSVFTMYARIARELRRLDPDIVHLHSSWAGLLGRLAPSPRSKIVYSPHCFAFERLDLPPWKRRAYRGAERLLTRRTGMLVGVSPREVALASVLNPRLAVAHVPQAAPEVPAVVHGVPKSEIVVTAVGRITGQKDPEWFLRFATHLRASGVPCRAQWLGAGDERLQEALRRGGVDVSGWLPRQEMLQRLASSSMYVHSAAWEGFPLSVVEAAGLGVPVVARCIPALESMRWPGLHPSPEVAAAWAADAVRRGLLPGYGEQMRQLAASYSRAAQSEHLVAAYSQLLGLCRPDVADDGEVERTETRDGAMCMAGDVPEQRRTRPEAAELLR